MPCMGPRWDFFKAPQITDELLEVLNKHGLSTFDLRTKNHWTQFDQKLKTKLFKLVKEIIQSDACKCVN